MALGNHLQNLKKHVHNEQKQPPIDKRPESHNPIISRSSSSTCSPSSGFSNTPPVSRSTIIPWSSKNTISSADMGSGRPVSSDHCSNSSMRLAIKPSLG